MTTPSHGAKPCPDCRGTGVITAEYGPVNCPTCHGLGKATDTPRTDAVAMWIGSHAAYFVPADFARALEKELAEAKREADEAVRRWEETENDYNVYDRINDENDSLRAERDDLKALYAAAIDTLKDQTYHNESWRTQLAQSVTECNRLRADNLMLERNCYLGETPLREELEEWRATFEGWGETPKAAHDKLLAAFRPAAAEGLGPRQYTQSTLA